MDDTAVTQELRGVGSGMSASAYETTHPVVGVTSTLRGEVKAALSELPARQRQVLSLRYLAGLDDTDISEAIGMSVRAVRKTAAQGRTTLRAQGVNAESILLLD